MFILTYEMLFLKFSFYPRHLFYSNYVQHTKPYCLITKITQLQNTNKKQNENLNSIQYNKPKQLISYEWQKCSSKMAQVGTLQSRDAFSFLFYLHAPVTLKHKIISKKVFYKFCGALNFAQYGLLLLFAYLQFRFANFKNNFSVRS